MAIKFLEPGGDATFDTSLYATVAGTPSVTTDLVRAFHIKSLNARPGFQDVFGKAAICADAGGRISFYLYIKTLPAATDTIAGITQTAFGGIVIRIRLTTTGAIELWDSAGKLGSTGGIASTGAWNRLCMAWTITSGAVNEVRIFLNGNKTVTVTNATITTVTSTDFLFGNASNDTNIDLRFSDIYVDDSTSLTDTGDIWVVAKRPNANGTTNDFTTQIGSGSSGYGSGHSAQVNERPLSQTNGWSMVGIGNAVTEEYNVESILAGDASISAFPIVGFMGWVSASSLLSETAQIIVNGSTSNISLTSTPTLFIAATTTTNYLAGTGADIGIITATTLTTVSLYECGVIVAWTNTEQNRFHNETRYVKVGDGMGRSEGAN